MNPQLSLHESHSSYLLRLSLGQSFWAYIFVFYEIMFFFLSTNRNKKIGVGEISIKIQARSGNPKHEYIFFGLSRYLETKLSSNWILGNGLKTTRYS